MGSWTLERWGKVGAVTPEPLCMLRMALLFRLAHPFSQCCTCRRGTWHILNTRACLTLREHERVCFSSPFNLRKNPVCYLSVKAQLGPWDPVPMVLPWSSFSVCPSPRVSSAFLCPWLSAYCFKKYYPDKAFLSFFHRLGLCLYTFLPCWMSLK